MSEAHRTSFEASELAIVLSHYEVGVIESITPLAKGSSRSPKVGIVSERGKFLLKRRDAIHCDPERIRFAHELQSHLKSEGFPAPAAIATRSGSRSFLRLQEHVYELFEFVAGQRFRGAAEECSRAGEVLGDFHRLTQNLKTKSAIPRGDYHDNAAVRRGLLQLKDVPGTDHAHASAMSDAYDQACAAAHSLGLPTFPPAVIHGDWHPGNMLFRGTHIAAVIDYDSVRVSRRMIDVANGALQFSLLAGASPQEWPDELDLTRYQAFLDGYEARSRFQPGERQSLLALMIEAFIAEVVAPIARTGTFAGMSTEVFLPMVLRKINWLVQHEAELTRRSASV